MLSVKAENVISETLHSLKRTGLFFSGGAVNQCKTLELS